MIDQQTWLIMVQLFAETVAWYCVPVVAVSFAVGYVWGRWL